MGKKTPPCIMLPLEYMGAFERMQDADIAAFIRAACMLYTGGTPENLPPAAALLFSVFAPRAAADMEKYADTIEKRRAAGIESGKARGKKPDAEV